MEVYVLQKTEKSGVVKRNSVKPLRKVYIGFDKLKATIAGRGKRMENMAKAHVPGVVKWSMHAGGTAAAPGKHGYTHRTPSGTYHVSPVSTRYGRHIGYQLHFTHDGPEFFNEHPMGLWHDLGIHKSPQAAATRAKTHNDWHSAQGTRHHDWDKRKAG